MIHLISTLFKTLFFAGIVLILGSLIKWDGRTISDQVKTGVAKAERSPWLKKTQNWVIEQKKDWLEPSQRKPLQRNKNNTAQSQRWDGPNEQHPTYREREKLRSLIQELNTHSD